MVMLGGYMCTAASGSTNTGVGGYIRQSQRVNSRLLLLLLLSAFTFFAFFPLFLVVVVLVVMVISQSLQRTLRRTL
jgi:hypothetical protein